MTDNPKVEKLKSRMKCMCNRYVTCQECRAANLRKLDERFLVLDQVDYAIMNKASELMEKYLNTKDPDVWAKRQGLIEALNILEEFRNPRKL